MALSQIGPERRAIPDDKQVLVDNRSDQRIVSIWSAIALSKEAASIPEKSRKTALEFSRTDSQIKRRAIEPRYTIAVSLRLGQMRGPRQATYSWSTQPAWSRRGRRTGRMITRDPLGTWETLSSPSKMAGGSPVDQLQDDPQLSPELWGRTGDETMAAAHNAVGLAGESPVVGIDCLPT